MPIKKGDLPFEENLTVKSPGTGMSPAMFYKILGKKINRSLIQDEELTETDLNKRHTKKINSINSC